jgi:protein TonB
MSRVIACVLLLGGLLSAQKGPHNAMVAPSRPTSSSAPANIPDSISPKPALTQFVQPLYPEYAKQLRIEGTVVLEISVDKDGGITSVKALSGPPLLIRPAVDAVKKWRYKPFEVDGRRVGMQTLVAINFELSGHERRR